MLGKGSYILAEVSKLTQLHPGRVRSWFKHRPDSVGRGPLLDSDYESIENDFAVSFLDLIDVLVAGQFRDHYNVSMRVVRRAYSVLKEELNVAHPFCHSGLYTDGKRIFQLAATKLGDEKLSDVISRQQFFAHIKEKLDHIEYNKLTRLADKWRIANGVLLDPNVSMGKPTVIETGLTTYVVANQYRANAENAGLVADLYGISEKDVANAVDFEKQYGSRYAA